MTDIRTHRVVAACFGAILLTQVAVPAYGQRSPDVVAAAGEADLPESTHAMLEMLNVRDADLRDVLRGIAQEYDLNLVVDNRIDRRITVRLSNLPVLDVISYLCRQNDVRLEQQGRILRVELPPPATPPPPKAPTVTATGDSITVDLAGDDLLAVTRALSDATSENIVVRQGVRGSVTGALTNVPFDVGLQTLMASNGFSVREKDGIWHIDRAGMEAGEGAAGARAFWVQVRDSLIEMDVAGAAISDVLREISAQTSTDLVTYASPEGRITARVNGLTIEEALDLLLKGTAVTYRRAGDVYVIGSKETSGIAATELLRLDHIRPDAVLSLLPARLTESATIQVVKEHNGLMITGTHDIISELRDIVSQLDAPTPQILIEALVVDFNASDLFELGATLGRYAEPEPSVDPEAVPAPRGKLFEFGGGTDQAGGFDYQGNGGDANYLLESALSIGSLFGIRKIGRLPHDFYFRIHALSLEGKANIRSRPQIATLNGHTASLSIGTTQYYILSSSTPYHSPTTVHIQESERFEKIEANVRLEITPWVSAAGEVTADIRPEFSTPVGEFTPGVPPTINSRILESTVRLRDGETIILGGLIQDSEEVRYAKVPFLGSIPLLGRLFRNRFHDRRKSELVIFLTPYVFYGDERDNDRWNDLRQRMELSGNGEAGRSIGFTRISQ